MSIIIKGVNKPDSCTLCKVVHEADEYNKGVGIYGKCPYLDEDIKLPEGESAVVIDLTLLIQIQVNLAGLRMKMVIILPKEILIFLIIILIISRTFFIKKILSLYLLMM